MPFASTPPPSSPPPARKRDVRFTRSKCLFWARHGLFDDRYFYERSLRYTKEFIQYVNIDELLPKLISKGLLSDNEMYMVKNPYLPPDQRISMLFQYISSKGPKGPSRLVECLTERPLVPGHMYLASRLAGDSKLGERTLLSCVFFSFLITLFESCCYYYMCMVKQMKLHIIAFICYYNISSALTHLLLYQLCPANKDYRVRFYTCFIVLLLLMVSLQ